MTDEPGTSSAQSPDYGVSPPQKLFTFKSGGWVLLLSAFFTLIAAALVLYPVIRNGGFRKPLGDGRNVDTYGFDLSNLTLPPGKLIASGNPKDQIRAISESLAETASPPEIELMRRNEHINFLVPSDRVIGIVIKGTARAYPLRVLDRHEMVNDVVEKTPIAVSYSPVCDSAVVFDRRIDGPGSAAVEFGVSGLLVDSNTVYFDRRSDLSKESLWPQLALKAVSGPKAGQAMTLIPYTIATWEEWVRTHPNTRALLGLRSIKKQYGKELYNTYHASDELKFPVSPLWTDPAMPRKTPILVTSSDGTTWKATRNLNAVEPSPYRLHTFLFAWFAQHEADTDFSELRAK